MSFFVDSLKHPSLRSPFVICYAFHKSEEKTMLAIVRTGGKQYKVREGALIKVEKIEGDIGAEVILDDILMVQGDGDNAPVSVGAPRVAGARVKGQIVEQGLRDKIVIYTYKRRKGAARKHGHRQTYTAIRVKEIIAS